MVLEYSIVCPDCQTVSKVICEEANPIIFACHGCDQNIVMHNDDLFIISEQSLADIMLEYNYVACGRVLRAHLSPKSQEKITRFKMKILERLLDENLDVSDFLKEI